jgi:hypothetical protein
MQAMSGSGTVDHPNGIGQTRSACPPAPFAPRMQQSSSTPEPMSRPDYAGGGIANLMASVLAGLGRDGERAAVPPSPLLPAARLTAARHVVLLVIDGLGRAQLEAHAPEGTLAAARVGDLSSVFPSTTASAVTTFMTGDVPLAHGLIGWHLWFRELGVVGAPLPFRVRGSKVGLERLGASTRVLFATRALASRLARRMVLVHPAPLCDTHYTRAHAAQAQVRPFAGIEELLAHIAALAHEREPSYCYAYWPELDSVSHEHGAGSARAGEHLRALDQALAVCARRIAGTGTLLLVCADHGFVDTREHTRLKLADHPRLAETLALPLCGEPRAVFCHVRCGAEAQFLDCAHESLGHAASVLSAQQVLAQELLGPGVPHPRVAERLGSHVLLMKEDYCLTDRVMGETRAFGQIGVHGGMSDAELRVPLALFES